jgi:hypothetical protein
MYGRAGFDLLRKKVLFQSFFWYNFTKFAEEPLLD